MKKILLPIVTTLVSMPILVPTITSCSPDTPTPSTPTISDSDVSQKIFEKTFNKDGTTSDIVISGFKYENMTISEVQSLSVRNSFSVSSDDTLVSTTIFPSSVTNESFSVLVNINGKSCLPEYSLVSNLTFVGKNGETIFTSYEYSLKLKPYATISDKTVFNRDAKADTTSKKVLFSGFENNGFDLSEQGDFNNLAVMWRHVDGDKIAGDKKEGGLNVPGYTTISFEDLEDMGTGTFTEKGYIQFRFKPDDGEWGTDDYVILTSYGFTITWEK